jgi:hypothetical protein
MRETTWKLGALAGLLLSLSGCMHTPVAIAASTRPLAPDGYEVLGPVEANDCLWALFGILPVSSGNHLYGALQKAIDKSDGGDALIQVSTESFYQHLIIISRSCTQVNGIAVRSRGTPPIKRAKK